MASDTPTVDEVKEEIIEQEYGGDESEFDEDEFDELVEENKSKFGDFGEGSMAAWAAAMQNYDDVYIESAFSLPQDESSGGSGPEIGYLEIEDIHNGAVTDDEALVELEGYVMDTWAGKSNNDNLQQKFILQDETGTVTVGATGDSSIQNLLNYGIQSGDYVRIENANVWNWTPDDQDEPLFGVGLPPFADFTFPDPDFELDDLAADFVDDVKSIGDFVKVDGIITETDTNTYNGCAICKSGYDKDENRKCPKCGHTEQKEWKFTRVQLAHGSETVTTQFSPGTEFSVTDDPMFEPVEMYGTYEKGEDQDGEEYDQVDVTIYEMVNDEIEKEDSSLETGNISTSDDDSSDDDESVTDDTEDVSESEDESDDEDGEEVTLGDVMDEGTNGHNGDIESVDLDDEQLDVVDNLHDQADQFGEKLPSAHLVKLMEKKYGVSRDEKPEYVQDIFQYMYAEGLVEINGADDTNEDAKTLIENQAYDSMYVKAV